MNLNEEYTSLEYKRRHRSEMWGIPYSEAYWLNFMKLDEVPTSALEVGCGKYGLWRFNNRVTGLDPIDYSEFSSNFRLGVAERLPYSDNSFEEVYCINALDHCENSKQAMQEMARVCRSRLIVWCCTFNEVLRPFFRLVYAPHPYCFTVLELMDTIPKNMKIELIVHVNLRDAFNDYVREPIEKAQLLLADWLGTDAVLIHLRKKTNI